MGKKNEDLQSYMTSGILGSNNYFSNCICGRSVQIKKARGDYKCIFILQKDEKRTNKIKKK